MLITILLSQQTKICEVTLTVIILFIRNPIKQNLKLNREELLEGTMIKLFSLKQQGKEGGGQQSQKSTAAFLRVQKGEWSP